MSCPSFHLSPSRPRWFWWMESNADPICDSSMDEVRRRTNKTSFYTFWDWYWCDPTRKLNGFCSYGKVWRVSKIILDIVQPELILIYPDSSLRVPVPFTNFIYKTHFIIGICSVQASNLKQTFRCNLLR